MTSPATRLKNQASATKRAATVLRNTALDNPLTDQERATLNSAASILEALSTRTATAARAKAQEEAAYEKAHRAALSKLQAHLKTLPMQTTGDKVRAALMTPFQHGTKFLINALKQPTLRELNWELDYYAENGHDECARSHAYHIAKGRYDLSAAINQIDAKAAELSASADALFLAQQFVDAIDKLKTAAHREAA